MRAKVACINWSHPDAPKAVSFLVDEDDDMIADFYHDTWTAALERANYLAGLYGGRR